MANANDKSPEPKVMYFHGLSTETNQSRYLFNVILQW